MPEAIARAAIGVAVALSLALHGLKKKSLSTSGCIAAFVVGFVHTAVSLRFGAILILFYYTSSYLTKVKQERKRVLEANYRVGGQRNYVQVLSNSAMATIVAAVFWYYVGEDRNVCTIKECIIYYFVYFLHHFLLFDVFSCILISTG
jgi:uncharacterized membrane protein